MISSLKNKITVPVIGIVFLMIVIIVAYVSMSTASLVDNFTDDRVTAATQAVRAYLDAHNQQTRIAAHALGNSAELIHLIHNGDRLAIWQHLVDVKAIYGVQEIIVADHEGITIARSHMRDSYDDNVSGVPSIAAGLRGELFSLYTRTPTAPMVMTTASPIMDGDVLVGSVVVNFVVGSEVFVDRVSEAFGIDITVFAGDERVASTIVDPATNRRAVNTVLEDQHVLSAVLEQGRTLALDTSIFGIPYTAYYFPLPGADGRPVGMFFIGLSHEASDAVTSSQQLYMIIIGAVSVVVAAAAMLFLITKFLKPLGNLTKTVNEVVAGNVNVNIDRQNLPKDEIGVLTKDVCGLVDVIKGMVDDLTNAHHEYIKVGNIHYTIDESKYQNAYGEMIGLINNLLVSVTTDILDVSNALGYISDGDFDKTLDADIWVGDWAVMPNAVNKLIFNLKSVSTEINTLINAAAVRGDLNFRIDESKYNDEWREIMKGLNAVAEAVDEPLKVIALAINEMRLGNFDLVDINEKLRARGLDENTGNYNGMFNAILTDFGAGIADIASYIDEISKDLVAISVGDLTTIITREFVGDFADIKKSLNSISTTLHKTMSDILFSSEQVLSGAKQISRSAQELANGAQEQASSVEELNATIDVINQQTKQNAENAIEASVISGKSTANAQEGNESMKEMLAAMSQIKDSSGEISKIIKAIQEIAFQTNLLALNASVEAARAGEHGKGFSVVAEEVRNLAGRSQNSVAETTSLIDISNTRVESGSNIAEATSKSLDMIVKNANEVSVLISNISAASKEQAEAIAQISEGLGQISKVTQSNSAVSEETAAASQELNSQAELLRQLVGYFKL